MSWVSVLMVSGAFFAMGCGADEGAGRKASSGLEEGEKQSEALICRGASWTAAQNVAAGFSGRDLVLVRAEGTRDVVHSFPTNTGLHLHTDGGGLTASAGELEGESVRVRRTGEVVWRLAGIAKVASDDGMGALVRGEPKIVRADGTVSEVPVQGWDSFEFLTSPDADGWMDARWTVYENDTNVEHLGRVNLDGKRFDELRREVADDSSNLWEVEDKEFVPTFLVNRNTGQRTPIRLDRLAPLRPLDGTHCNRAVALADGRIGVGMRDGASAGFFVGNADGTGWERVGLALRDVTAISAEHVGSTWVLTATTGLNTYCPPYEPFAESEAPALSGDSLQIVHGSDEPFVFRGPSQWNLGEASLDPSGTCVFRRDAAPGGTPRFIDLTRRAEVETLALEWFTWL